MLKSRMHTDVPSWRRSFACLLVIYLSFLVWLSFPLPAQGGVSDSDPVVVTVDFAKRNIRLDEPAAIFKSCRRFSLHRVRCLVGVPAIIVTEEPGNPEVEITEGHVFYWIYDVRQRWMNGWMTKESKRELMEPDFNPFE